jgi:hypothetical protein
MIASSFDWSALGSAADPNVIPVALRGLANSRSVEEAEEYYWKIDNNAMVQGLLYESSYATICCAIGILYQSNSINRQYILEIVSEISGGYVVESCMEEIKQDIMRESCANYGYFDYYFINGSNSESAHCMDILRNICCWTDIEYLREKFLKRIRASSIESKNAIERIVLERLNINSMEF